MTPTETAIHDVFSPIVRSALGDYATSAHIGTTRVEFVESSPLAQIYDFVVPVVPNGDRTPLTAYDLAAIANGLDLFGQFEEPEAEQTIDGVAYTIGDGDDSLAVQFRDNEFRIWVRVL